MDRNIDKISPIILCMCRSSLLEDWFGLLDLILAQTPLVLQLSVEASLVDRLGPPFTPAGQENLLWINRDVLRMDRAKDVLGT